MKRFVVAAAVAAVLGMVTAPAASAQQTLSPTCQMFNDAYYDDLFTSAIGYSGGSFTGGERISASATVPAEGSPTTITILYRGVVVDTAPFPGEVAYTIPEHGVGTELRFETDSGAVTWNIDCGEPDPDIDDDGLGNRLDNCASIANADQANNDRDIRGDVCDADDDNDFVADATDNCQFAANFGQEDADGDGIGDACDPAELPTAQEQCKDGGWQAFYDGTSRFKNQGDCVSFVATGAKNRPAG